MSVLLLANFELVGGVCAARNQAALVSGLGRPGACDQEVVCDMLPPIRKAASIHTPHPGRRGVLAQFHSSAAGAVVGSGRSREGAEEETDRDEAGAASMGASPTNAARAGPTASTVRPASPLKPKTPETPRREARRQRQLLARTPLTPEESRAVITGREPGDWDAQSFCELRARFAENGRWAAVSGLSALAVNTSQQALDAGGYSRQRGGVAKIPPCLRSFRWYSAKTSVPPSVSQDHRAPPLICAAMGPLEAHAALRAACPAAFTMASFEATDFDAGGFIAGATARSAAQQELFVRTNLEMHCKAASSVAGGNSEFSVKDRLTTRVDGYVLVLRDVAVFRGPTDQGYPFLREPASVNMLIGGRSTLRPEMGEGGEYFLHSEDMAACEERLELLALGAFTASLEDDMTKGETEEAARCSSAWQGQRPSLVIAAHDLTATGARQPRHSLGAALKTWREKYASRFEAVVVACGDRGTAAMLDKIINGAIYASAAQSRVATADWPPLQLLELSAGSKLAKLARGAGASRLSKSRSQASTCEALSEAAACIECGASLSLASLFCPRCGHRVLQAPAPISPRALQDDPAKPQPSTSLGLRQASKPSQPPTPRVAPKGDRAKAQSAKAVHDGFLQRRLSESKKVDPIAEARRLETYQSYETEAQARSGAARAMAIMSLCGTRGVLKQARKRLEKGRKKLGCETPEVEELPSVPHSPSDGGCPENLDETDLFFDEVYALAGSLRETLTRKREHAAAIESNGDFLT